MQIVVTNDDGIYAPGLEALSMALRRLGEVTIVAPGIEQSGVSHSITYLEPLMVQEVQRHQQLFGRAVMGSPADCVKLAVLEFCPTKPDLVVSGINSGANTGINVLYSGTVAGAIEGAFFGITSIAVSLSLDLTPDFDRAATLAAEVIEQLLATSPPVGSLWNINLPATRADWPLGVKVLPMGVRQYREITEKRLDPRGRPYYWVSSDPTGPHSIEPDSDVAGIAEGFVTVTPLHFNLTDQTQLQRMRKVVWTIQREAKSVE